MKLRVLGAHASLSPGTFPCSFLLGKEVLLDAGAATTTLELPEQYAIDHILLSGCTLAHIQTIAFLADNVIGFRKGAVRIYATAAMIQQIYTDFYNNSVWPDFTKIPVPDNPVVTFVEIEPGKSFNLPGLKINPIALDGDALSLGYLIHGGNSAFAYASDPGSSAHLWQKAGEEADIQSVLINLPVGHRPAIDLLRRAAGSTPRKNLPLLFAHTRPDDEENVRGDAAALLEGIPYKFLTEGQVVDLCDPMSGKKDVKAQIHQSAEKPDESLVIDTNNAGKQRQVFERYGRSFRPGETIFQEGDEGRELYIIQEGQVKLFKIIRNERRVIETLGAGEFFGEMAVLNSRPRSLTAEAVTDVKLLIFPPETFESLVVSNAGLATRIIRTLAGRLQHADNHIENLLYQDAESKLVNALLKQIDNSGIPERGGYKLQVKPGDLAELVGLPVDVIKTVMGKLSKTRIVEIQKQALFVPSIEKLEKMLSMLSLRAELGFSEE